MRKSREETARTRKRIIKAASGEKEASELPNDNRAHDMSHRCQRPLADAVGVSLVSALPDVVATAHPYPLAWAGRRLLDDRPSVDIDVGRCGDAAPKDRICFR